MSKIYSSMVKADNVLPNSLMTDATGYFLGKISKFYAKIAYGFAIGWAGYGNFDPYILPYLQSDEDVPCPMLVGESPLPYARDYLHKVEMRVERVKAHKVPGLPPAEENLIIVDVFLFGHLPLRVVVGALKHPLVKR